MIVVGKLEAGTGKTPSAWFIALSDSESVHNRFDQASWNDRVISCALERQTASR